MEDASRFIQVQVGAGALICALDQYGNVFVFNHNTQTWDKLPETRNENGSTKQSPLRSL
jgi:hypothetical protein